MFNSYPSSMYRKLVMAVIFRCRNVQKYFLIPHHCLFLQLFLPRASIQSWMSRLSKSPDSPRSSPPDTRLMASKSTLQCLIVAHIGHNGAVIIGFIDVAPDWAKYPAVLSCSDSLWLRRRAVDSVCAGYCYGLQCFLLCLVYSILLVYQHYHFFSIQSWQMGVDELCGILSWSGGIYH